MRNQPETQHIYNIPRLNRVFLWSSVAALLVTVWMIYSDWDREWKVYQEENKRIEAEKVRQDLEAARQSAKLDAERLDAEIRKQQTTVGAKGGELAAAEAAFEKADVAQKNADVEFKFAKADLDALKSGYEHAAEEAATELVRARKLAMDEALREARKEAHVAKLGRALADLTARVNKLDLALQDAEAAKKIAKAKLDAINGALGRLKKDRERLLLDQDKAQKRLATLTTAGIRSVLDAPLMESFQPSLRVDQKILDDHRININFADVPRVDRCMTCHVNADKKVSYPVIVPADEAGNKPVNADDLADFVDKGREKGWVGRDELNDFVAKTLKLNKGVTAAQLNTILGALREAGVEYRDFYRRQALPFAAHPRMDLFVGSESPHPAEKFGCTSCHWGWDRDVRFTDAAHTPDAHKKVKAEWEEPPSPWRAMFGATASKEKFEGSQENYWKKRYGWYELEELDQKMRPAKYVEAACLKCHVNVTEVPHAPKLNRGLQLIDQAGCWSCHRVKQVEHTLSHKVRPGEDLVAIARLYSVDVPRIKAANNLIGEPKPGQMLEIPVRKLERGPALGKIASKVNPDWIRKWLEDPPAFRPNAYMPRFWGLENNGEHVRYQGVRGGDIKATERNAVEIEAIAAFITANSQKPAMPSPPVKGDAKRGEQLVSVVGCYGCHVVNEKIGELKADPRKTAGISDPQYRRMRTHGPMLAGIGSKTSEGWLFAWLKDPKSWNAGTRMPNLRLSDPEAADIAAFLMTLRNEEFDKRGQPAVKAAVLDDVAEEYLQNTLPAKEARAVIDAKSDADRKRLDAVLHESLKSVWGEKDVAPRLAGLDFNAK
ncbi:MAG: c-type cytochrome, partial [Verrucomicrobia bacterium]|nr:c-type cytochrome [Verrucomicrobiota bacterium]